jgi:hypothetical protein
MQNISWPAAAATIVAAAPSIERRASVHCTDFTITITASAPTTLFVPPVIPDAADSIGVLTTFVLATATGELAGGPLTTGTFDISARYCPPTTFVPSRANTIQYLQHAITTNKNYWNGEGFPVGFDGAEYSWIDFAGLEGYPTISVDALGSGNSTHPDPLFVVQQPLQLEITHQIIGMLKDGTVPNPALHGKKFDKVVYVGKSYWCSIEALDQN